MPDTPQPDSSQPDLPPAIVPEVNPVTQQRFRRQSFAQVTLPVVAFAVLGVAGIVLLIVLGGPPAVSVVADFASILLILLALLPLLILLGVFGGLAYLLIKAIGGTPPLTFKVQMFLQRVYQVVDEATDRVANVVIEMESRIAGMQTARGEGGDTEPIE